MTQPARTILVVEDNPLTRKMLRLALETEGYRVLEAQDGRTAVAIATHEMPELVLQDLILPDMNGFDLARQLRALPTGDSVPIVALSGFSGSLDEARTVEAGFTALLGKPIEPSRLLDAIEGLLPAASQRVAPLSSLKTVLLVDDDPGQLKLARLHLERAGFLVFAASSTTSALDHARREPPDIVVSEVLMAELDGFELCGALRRDPRTAHVPVVLTSSFEPNDADRELARRAGAHAIVLGRTDLWRLSAAITEAVASETVPVPEEWTAATESEHAQWIARQLRRELAVSAELARRCTLQAAQISLLGGLAGALTRGHDPDVALRDVLAATLDAAAISKGAIFLRDDHGSLTPRHAIGFSRAERARLESFFGHFELLEDAVARQGARSVPSAWVDPELAKELLDRAGATTMQIVPLVSESRGRGAMILAAKRTDVTNEDAIAFARAMGNQLAQSLDLAQSFAKLAASEERYRTVTESANDAIVILSPDGVILEVNRSFEQILGIAQAELEGKKLRDLVAPGHANDGARSEQRSPGDGSARTRILALRRADGSVALVDFSNRTAEVGGHELVVAIGRDVTEQVKSQAQLMVADRMVSIGTLAAGVAHEINNPLAAVMANVDYAASEVDDLAASTTDIRWAPVIAALRDAREASNQVRTIVRDVKIFSRAEEETRRPVDVQLVLESCIRMAWNEIRHRARLVRDLGVVPLVHANEARLGQVFLNLIVNAAQALPEGQANRNEIRIRTFTKDGNACVEIGDTGPGIPPEVLPRLFTPFFTTKPVGVGTGLGLSICQRIVSGLGGEITIDSAVGNGTVFRVVLPPTGESPPPEAPLPNARQTCRRQLLVVDDEPMVAAAIWRMLSSRHDVTTTTSAADALARLSRGERYDMILCDVMMPVISGIEFYDVLRARAPEEADRIVFVTGGAFTVQAREFLDRIPNARLEKPFTAEAVLAILDERTQ
jgi:PAS domain S-box-containing protein